MEFMELGLILTLGIHDTHFVYTRILFYFIQTYVGVASHINCFIVCTSNIQFK